jgi:hypothetical protein
MSQMPASPSRLAATPRLLDEVRAAIRVRHYSIRTEAAYVDWVKRFVLFHGKRHPRELGEAEVGAFLTHLALTAGVAPSTQNQALNALVFLYRFAPRKGAWFIFGARTATTCRQRRASGSRSGNNPDIFSPHFDRERFMATL